MTFGRKSGCEKLWSGQNNNKSTSHIGMESRTHFKACSLMSLIANVETGILSEAS